MKLSKAENERAPDAGDICLEETEEQITMNFRFYTYLDENGHIKTPHSQLNNSLKPFININFMGARMILRA